jgi:hypothetical protein
VLPHLIGSDIDLTIVRAVADLARAEEWDDIVSTVLPSLQDKTGLASVSNKLAILSPYLALIGLVAVAAVVIRRRKA